MPLILPEEQMDFKQSNIPGNSVYIKLLLHGSNCLLELADQNLTTFLAPISYQLINERFFCGKDSDTDKFDMINLKILFKTDWT